MVHNGGQCKQCGDGGGGGGEVERLNINISGNGGGNGNGNSKSNINGKGLVLVIVMVYTKNNIMQVQWLGFILLQKYCRQELMFKSLERNMWIRVGFTNGWFVMVKQSKHWRLGIVRYICILCIEVRTVGGMERELR